MASPLRAALRAAALVCGLLLAAGCSSFGKKDAPVEQPAELTALDSDSVHAREVWSASAGALPKKDVYGLRLAGDGQQLYAADGEGVVRAFSAERGRALWRADTRLRLVSGPAVVGDVVLVGSLDGELQALARADGKPLWRVGLSSEVLAAAAGAGEVVVARTGDGRLHGLALADGKRLWSFDRSVPTLTLRGSSSPLVAEDRVFAGLDTGKAVALALDSGKLLWEEVVSQPSGRSEVDRLVDVDADPVQADGILYFVSYGGRLTALDAASGTLRWQGEVASYSGLSVDGERLYASDREGRVWALDRATGARLWQQEALKHRRLTRPVLQDGHVAVGDFEGYVHWLSPADGSLQGRLRVTREALIAPPLSGGSRLYLLDRGGGISAVDLRPKR